MLKDVTNPSFCEFPEQQFVPGFNLAQAHAEAEAEAQALARYNNALDEAIYGSDEFRMYAYKIKRCTRMRSHDWTECPYAHRGEKAQRRDPRKFLYTAIACPAFRNGKCQRGDACEFAHGVFEYWLHPTKYRTRACNAGMFCQRKVCFFAHTPDQLRSDSKFSSPFAHKRRMVMKGRGDHQLMMMMRSPSGGVDGSMSMQAQYEEPSPPPPPPHQLEGVSTLLKSLRTLKMREDEARELNNNNKKKSIIKYEDGDGEGDGNEMADLGLPHLDWITDILK